MPRARSFKTSFNSGEISPDTTARADIASYKNAAETLTNWRQLLQGGIVRRPGLQKRATLTPTIPYQLERFIFDDNQRYVFIFSNARVDIVNDSTGAIVASLTGASAPWTTAMIGFLYITSEGDSTIVMHADLPTRIIKRTGASSFTSSLYTFETDTASPAKKFIPFEKFAADSVTITPSGTTGAITVTASASYFLVAHVGLRIRYKGKQMLITARASGSSISCTVIETLPSITVTDDWDEEAFSSIYGYPVSGIFHDQRLHFAGTKTLPRHYFASNIGAFFKFDVGTGLDSEALQGIVAESNVGAIRAIASLRQLHIFCDQGEILIPSTDAKPLTPANLAFKIQSRYGTKVNHAADFDSSTLYISNGGAVREFVFDELQSGFDSFSLTFLSRHLLKDAKRITSQLEGFGNQEQYAFVVNNTDGTMAVLLNETNEKVTSWSRWTTTGVIKDAIAIGNNVYAIVQRNIGGSNVQWLEQFQLDYMLDAAQKFFGPTQSVWTGLTDYANQTVSVLSGNFYLGTFPVTAGGVLDLGDFEFSSIEVGLNFTPTLKTLPPELQLQDGPTFGELRRVVKVVVLFKNTFNAIVSGNKLIVRQITDDVEAQPVAVNGKKEFYMRGWDREGQIEIIQDTPLPLTILGLNVELEF